MTSIPAARKQCSDIYVHGTFHPQEQVDSSNAERAINIDSAAPTKVIIVKKPAVPNIFGLKPTKLPIYDGDRQSYPAWRRAVLRIFQTDWNTFGYDDQRAFGMIYNALRGAAQQNAVAFFELGGVNGTQRPEDFLEYLDRMNYDPKRFDRATNGLFDMKMGDRQSWPSFFAEWTHKLSEARCDGWADKCKIIMLRNTLNYKLSKALARNHLLPNDDYNEWVRIVSQISQQLDMVGPRSRQLTWRSQIALTESLQTEYEESRLGNSSASQNNHLRKDKLDTSGDEIRGKILASDDIKYCTRFERSAMWKSPSQIKRLREEGLCFRCERRGCSTRTCYLGPAVRPKEGSGPGACGTDVLPVETLMCKPKTPAKYVKAGELDASKHRYNQKQEAVINPGSRMNTGPFLVNALLDDVTMVQALADNGVMCSGIIDKTAAISMGLPCIPISPRAVETAEDSSKNKSMVDSITYVSLVLDGLVPTKLWLCVGNLD